MSGDRKQKTLQRRRVVVVGKSRQESQKRLLDDVFCRGAAAEAALHKRDQPPFEAVDALLPGLGIAGTDAFDEQFVGVRCSHLSRRKSITGEAGGETSIPMMGGDTSLAPYAGRIILPAVAGTRGQFQPHSSPHFSSGFCNGVS